MTAPGWTWRDLRDTYHRERAENLDARENARLAEASDAYRIGGQHYAQVLAGHEAERAAEAAHDEAVEAGGATTFGGAAQRATDRTAGLDWDDPRQAEAALARIAGEVGDASGEYWRIQLTRERGEDEEWEWER